MTTGCGAGTGLDALCALRISHVCSAVALCSYLHFPAPLVDVCGHWVEQMTSIMRLPQGTSATRCPGRAQVLSWCFFCGVLARLASTARLPESCAACAAPPHLQGRLVAGGAHMGRERPSARARSSARTFCVVIPSA